MSKRTEQKIIDSLKDDLNKLTAFIAHVKHARVMCRLDERIIGFAYVDSCGIAWEKCEFST